MTSSVTAFTSVKLPSSCKKILPYAHCKYCVGVKLSSGQLGALIKRIKGPLRPKHRKTRAQNLTSQSNQSNLLRLTRRDEPPVILPQRILEA